MISSELDRERILGVVETLIDRAGGPIRDSRFDVEPQAVVAAWTDPCDAIDTPTQAHPIEDPPQ